MKLNDLLDMLRAEFALDVPPSLNTLANWQASPDVPPATLPDMLSFLDRSAEVVQIVGMQGLARFLQQVRTFSERVSHEPPDRDNNRHRGKDCQKPEEGHARCDKPKLCAV